MVNDRPVLIFVGMVVLALVLLFIFHLLREGTTRALTSTCAGTTCAQGEPCQTTTKRPVG